MKKELLDKEVLCILDTRQIQRYMFRSNTFIDTLGGSDIMKHVLNDAIIYAIKNIDEPLSDDEYDLSIDPVAEIPYFSSERIKFQLIICSAGNALCIIRTGALAQKLIRKISRYYLDNGYSLNLTAAATQKTQDFGNDIFHLYKELNAIKAASAISNPLGTLNVIQRENRTGEPIITKDSIIKDPISRSSEIRRNEARKRDVVVDMASIKKSHSLGKEYIAVLHADGNNLGMTIGRILQTTPSYEAGIRKRRMLNHNITTSYKRVMDQTMKDLEEVYHHLFPGEDDFDHSFVIIHQAGDDINIMCRATLVFPFIDAFYRNLKSAVLWEEGDFKIPLYVCTGVAFVTPERSFHSAFKLAEDCCASAKSSAKKEENLRNGYAGNWIDFQICDNPHFLDLDMIREESFVNDQKESLLLRPYCFDQEEDGKDISYYRFIERAKNIKNMYLSKDERKSMGLSYMLGKQEIQKWIKTNGNRTGIDFEKQLGKPYIKTEDEGTRAVWFDPCQIADFL
ncbi:MAG: hypothetical protein K6E91_04535 [Butyrivibrio sp.]|nr:hypothetical protein [Butyrivibrio sp.]